MFAGGYFAKTFFTGAYFAPNDSGTTTTDGVLHIVGMHVNIGTMMSRM